MRDAPLSVHFADLPLLCRLTHHLVEMVPRRRRQFQLSKMTSLLVMLSKRVPVTGSHKTAAADLNPWSPRDLATKTVSSAILRRTIASFTPLSTIAVLGGLHISMWSGHAACWQLGPQNHASWHRPHILSLTTEDLF